MDHPTISKEGEAMGEDATSMSGDLLPPKDSTWRQFVGRANQDDAQFPLNAI
jgi:hypothetical protein